MSGNVVYIDTSKDIINQVRNITPPCCIDINNELLFIATIAERGAFINGVRCMAEFMNSKLDETEG